MKKATNQKVKTLEIKTNLMARICELATIATKTDIENPLFMEITKIQCELIKLKHSL